MPGSCSQRSSRSPARWRRRSTCSPCESSACRATKSSLSAPSPPVATGAEARVRLDARAVLRRRMALSRLPADVGPGGVPPPDGGQKKRGRRRVTASAMIASVRSIAEPLAGTPRDLDIVVNAADRARFVLIGEASHGVSATSCRARPTAAGLAPQLGRPLPTRGDARSRTSCRRGAPVSFRGGAASARFDSPAVRHRCCS